MIKLKHNIKNLLSNYIKIFYLYLINLNKNINKKLNYEIKKLKNLQKIKFN